MRGPSRALFPLPGRAVEAIHAIPHVHGPGRGARRHARPRGVVARRRHLAARGESRAVDLLYFFVGAGVAGV